MFGGIDPGASSGAYVLLGSDGIPTFTADFTCWRDVSSFLKQFENRNDVLFLLEKVHGNPLRGSKSSFVFGANFGGWEALLQTLNIPYVLVPPQTWQKAILGSFPKGESKKRAYDFANKRWPSLNLHPTKKEGVIDALCMALFVRKQHLNVL